MNKKNLQLIAIMLVGLHMIEQPTQATLVNSAKTIPTNLPSAVVLATTLYIGYNFLTRQDCLVSNKFEAAQAWYDSITIKYPQANLDKIIFIQTPKSGPIADALAGFAKKCSWTSSTNHIYMTKDTLKEINFLYKKVLDGYTLDDKEIGKLAGHEFTILHQAGHIKHNDAQTLLASVYGLLGTSVAMAHYHNENINQTNDKTIYNGISTTRKGVEIAIPFDKTYTCAESYKDHFLFKGAQDIFGKSLFSITVPGTMTSVSTGAFIAALITILRYQEANADAFAIETADLLALKNGLKSFENDDTDVLYDIENKTLSPYVETDSFIGKFFQSIVGSVEMVIGFSQQQLLLIVKSTKPTRMMFDFYKNPIQQSPFIRAQAIKDEIKKRQESN